MTFMSKLQDAAEKAAYVVWAIMGENPAGFEHLLYESELPPADLPQGDGDASTRLYRPQ